MGSSGHPNRRTVLLPTADGQMFPIFKGPLSCRFFPGALGVVCVAATGIPSPFSMRIQRTRSQFCGARDAVRTRWPVSRTPCLFVSQALDRKEIGAPDRHRMSSGSTSWSYRFNDLALSFISPVGCCKSFSVGAQSVREGSTGRRTDKGVS